MSTVLETSEPSPLYQGGWGPDRKWLYCVNNRTWVIYMQGQANISLVVSSWPCLGPVTHWEIRSWINIELLLLWRWDIADRNKNCWCKNAFQMFLVHGVCTGLRPALFFCLAILFSLQFHSYTLCCDIIRSLGTISVKKTAFTAILRCHQCVMLNCSQFKLLWAVSLLVDKDAPDSPVLTIEFCWYAATFRPHRRLALIDCHHTVTLPYTDIVTDNWNLSTHVHC